MPKPKRKVPMRTCVGCRQVAPKRELVRVVRGSDGRVAFDPTGKRAGRGAYVCKRVSCLETALKRKQLERALERDLDEAAKSELRAVMQEMEKEQEQAREPV